MNRELIDQWCERGILALVLGILLFGPLGFGAVRPFPFLVVQGLTIGVLIFWAVRFAVNPKHRLLWPPVCWAVVAFCLYAIGRYWTADIEYVAREELVRVLIYTFLFFAILNNLHRQESTQVISFSLVFLGMAISGYSVYQFLSKSNQVWHLYSFYEGRGTGTYMSPNNLGGFLDMAIPLGLAYTIVGRAKHVTKIFLAYAGLVMCAGLAVTLSRGAWVATALALIFFFSVLLMNRRYRVPAAVLLILLVAAGAYLAPKSLAVQHRLQQLNSSDGGERYRFALWQPALKVWRENVWWGAGPAHYDYRFRAYRPEMVQLRPDRAHNDYINTLADWGIVGAVLVGSAWVLLGIGVAKTWRFVRASGADLGQRRGSNKYAFVLGASAALLGILLHSFVDFNMHVPANAIVAVCLMALLASHLRFASDRYWAGSALWIRLTMVLLLLAGVGFLSVQGTRRAREYLWQDRAERAEPLSDERVSFLKKAHVMEPKNGDTTYAIGEILRAQSRVGGDNYRELATEAMQWFERGMKLDPWNGYNYLGYGLCLDWLDRETESGPYFSRAEELDPNGYYTLAHIGMHFVATRDYAAAKSWFERSLKLEGGAEANPLARAYLGIVQGKLMEASTNEVNAILLQPTGGVPMPKNP